MKKTCIVLLFTFLSSVPLWSCTTIIFSGKATRDGRPLMWKNADTDNLNHRLAYSGAKGYPYIGIARNTSPDSTASIWIGTNAKGFSIMNTLSYNLTKEMDSSRNGTLMRKALETCRNVPDFKNFLDTLARPMKVEANFGVMDAEGNAAYFETNSSGYYMVDVNDPSVAPNGYLVYTNFSYNGFYDAGEGYIRFRSAQYLAAKGAPSKAFSPQWIFNNLARSYYHSLMDVDFKSQEAMALFQNGYLHDSDFIPRRSTASSTVIQGVRKDENPELTTVWVVLGYPPCSVAVPAWVKAGKENCSLLMQSDSTRKSPLCNWVLDVKANVFNEERGHGKEYLDFSQVYNPQGTGYMQKLAPVENHIFETVNPFIDTWRNAGVADGKEMQAIGKYLTQYIEESWQKYIKK